MGDAFELLGIDPAFELDLGAVERRHRDLSRALHPDRFAGRPPTERRQALSKAIEVNDAWRTVRDPVRRAEALLARLGLSSAEGQGPEPATAPELLMDLLELREQLGEARRERDAAAVEKLRRDVLGRQARVEQNLAQSFSHALRSAPTDELRDALLGQLGELRYYRKFIDDACVIEDEIL